MIFLVEVANGKIELLKFELSCTVLMGGKAMGAKETVGKATRVKVSGAKATRAQDNHETGETGDTLMGEKEMDSMLPSDTAAGQNMTKGY